MSAMSHVAVKFEMIARRIAQVIVILRSQAMQQSKYPNLTQPSRALGVACGLLRHASRKGNNHLPQSLPCIPSRKAECVAMWDLIRGSTACSGRT
jgi:hypothetical protein